MPPCSMQCRQTLTSCCASCRTPMSISKGCCEAKGVLDPGGLGSSSVSRGPGAEHHDVRAAPALRAKPATVNPGRVGIELDTTDATGADACVGTRIVQGTPPRLAALATMKGWQAGVFLRRLVQSAKNGGVEDQPSQPTQLTDPQLDLRRHQGEYSTTADFSGLGGVFLWQRHAGSRVRQSDVPGIGSDHLFHRQPIFINHGFGRSCLSQCPWSRWWIVAAGSCSSAVARPGSGA